MESGLNCSADGLAHDKKEAADPRGVDRFRYRLHATVLGRDASVCWRARRPGHPLAVLQFSIRTRSRRPV